MPTREQILGALIDGRSYDEVAADWGIPPGQAYLIATGLPADGSDVLGPEYLARREKLLTAGSQALANPSLEVPSETETALAWVKHRVAGDEPMRRAAVTRTAEPPALEGEDRSDDVIDVLGRQHNQVKYLQEKLEALPGVRQGGSAAHQQMRVSIVDMMRERLSRHETVEEEHFWPAVRSGVPDGEQFADTALEQEQQGKDLLQALDGLAGDDDRFDELVEQLSAALRKHVAFEDRVFLAAKEHLPDEQRNELGRRISQSYVHAPTRPHPHAPAGSKIAAAAAVPLDRARDAMGERPAKRKGKSEGTPPSESTDDS